MHAIAAQVGVSKKCYSLAWKPRGHNDLLSFWISGRIETQIWCQGTRKGVEGAGRHLFRSPHLCQDQGRFYPSCRAAPR